jgi:hypothetical protein
MKVERRRVAVSCKWNAWGLAWVSEAGLLAIQFGPFVLETWRADFRAGYSLIRRRGQPGPSPLGERS